MRTSTLLCLFAAAFAAQSLAGCSEIGLVGGKCDQQQVVLAGSCLDSCPDGLSACSGTCVDLQHDEQHCGSCGNVCGAQEACLAGECVASGTGGSSGASQGGGAGEGPAGEAGEGGSGGSGGSAPICEPPFDTPEHCGSCDVKCSAAEPVCAPVGGGYECQPLCEPSDELCDGSCTDLDTDPGHCGECGNVCASGYCFQGSCVGGTFGHVVLMCIDYEQTGRSSPIQRLLGNSVFLPGARFARILAFDGFTPASLRDNVDLTLSWAANEGGQSYRMTHESDPGSIPDRLKIENFDTFLVYAQPDAPSGQLAALGASWESKMGAFVDGGGTIVVLSGGEMRQFITSGGLLEVTAETEVTGKPLFNRTPTDAVGINVLSPFQARANSCRFTTPEVPSAALSYVVTGDPPTQPLDAPVVVHRILTRP